mgnify:CR=1 FL=1
MLSLSSASAAAATTAFAAAADEDLDDATRVAGWLDDHGWAELGEKLAGMTWNELLRADDETLRGRGIDDNELVESMVAAIGVLNRHGVDFDGVTVAHAGYLKIGSASGGWAERYCVVAGGVFHVLHVKGGSTKASHVVISRTVGRRGYPFHAPRPFTFYLAKPMTDTIWLQAASEAQLERWTEVLVESGCEVDPDEPKNDVPSQLGDPVLAGYLERRMSKKSWEPQYCVLHDCVVYIYCSEFGHLLESFVALGWSVGVGAKAKRDHTFFIAHKNQPTYWLQAPSAAERDAWVTALLDTASCTEATKPPVAIRAKATKLKASGKKKRKFSLFSKRKARRAKAVRSDTGAALVPISERPSYDWPSLEALVGPTLEALTLTVNHAKATSALLATHDEDSDEHRETKAALDSAELLTNQLTDQMRWLERELGREPVVLPSLKLLWVTALYDYDAVDSEELSFKAGDRMSVVDLEADPEWYSVKLGDSTGLVPITYVELVEDTSISHAPDVAAEPEVVAAAAAALAALDLLSSDSDDDEGGSGGVDEAQTEEHGQVDAQPVSDGNNQADADAAEEAEGEEEREAEADEGAEGAEAGLETVAETVAENGNEADDGGDDGDDGEYNSEDGDEVYPAVALYPYAGDDEDELRVAEGEQIEVLDKDSDPDWYYAMNAAGEEGIVPAAYIKILASSKG